MIFSLLPHILGICCALYALQLLYRLGQDFKGKTLATALVPFCGGLLAILLAAAAVIGVDLVFPVGSTVSQATFFIRICFLVPLAYLAVFVTGHLVAAAIGKRYSANIVSHTANLGITLLVLLPVGKMWFTQAMHFFTPGP